MIKRLKKIYFDGCKAYLGIAYGMHYVGYIDQVITNLIQLSIFIIRSENTSQIYDIMIN